MGKVIRPRKFRVNENGMSLFKPVRLVQCYECHETRFRVFEVLTHEGWFLTCSECKTTYHTPDWKAFHLVPMEMFPNGPPDPDGDDRAS